MYPIFCFEAHWSQQGEQNLKYPNWHKDLPEGRIWNSMSYNYMYRQTPSDIVAEMDQWWQKVNREKFIDIQNLTLTHALYRTEEWCLSWFEHWTFDVGQSDEEALASFQRFVDRTLLVNRQEGKVVNGIWTEPHCLMGAEDRWRWCGAESDGEQNSRSDPPCRCKFCKQRGVIKIGH